jgi:hypothetical protein
VSFHLVVSRPFGKYERGQQIHDQAELQAIWNSDMRHNVVRAISKPEQTSGDFFRTDAELSAKRDGHTDDAE